MSILKTFSRIFVGLVFVFSGFVKGVDPLGTGYRIEDYFIAYGIDWAIPLALFLSITLCTLEFLLGIALVLKLRINVLSWVLFPMMIFFTLLTFYDALYNPVPDCGCFGDAVKLTNWQTFYKNIVLIIFVFIIFKFRKDFNISIHYRIQNFLLLVFALIFSVFSFYQYNHLPFMDFREWKVGNDMKIRTDDAVEKIYLTYKNNQTGEEKEFLTPDYPWNDSVWMSQWEFVKQRVDRSGIRQNHDLYITTPEGDDITREIVENPDYQFLFISYDLNKAPSTALKKIKNISNYFDEMGISLTGLTSSTPAETKEIVKQNSLDFIFYNADDITLRTMIRANPGLILLKNGVIIDKWHYNDFPDIEKLKKQYGFE